VLWVEILPENSEQEERKLATLQAAQMLPSTN